MNWRSLVQPPNLDTTADFQNYILKETLILKYEIDRKFR